MNVEEAIKTSIEYETRVRDVYADAMKAATDPVGKKVFRVLAKEEQYHLDFLQDKLRELKETGTVTSGGLNTTIPSPETIQEGVSKLEKRISDADYGKELNMLKKALDVEMETSAFYRKMVDTLPEEDQKLFTRFVEIEEGHVAIVQAEMDTVQGLGFWFDFKEFSLEAE